MKRIVLSMLFLALATLPAFADHDEGSGNEFGGCAGDATTPEDDGDGCVSSSDDGGCAGNESTFGLFALATLAASRRRVA